MSRQIPRFGLVLTTAMCIVGPSACGQGLFKRLQGRVQSLEPQDPPANARGAVPEVGQPDAARRRPLLDALLQYGPEILSGEEAARAGAGARQTVPNADPLGGRLPPGVTVSPKPRPQASLGVNVLESAPGIPGVLVTGFRVDSKADDAGLKKGDVIVSLDRTLTPRIADIAAFLAQRQPGQVVEARVLRGDQMTTMRVPLLGPDTNAKGPQNPAHRVPPPPLPQAGLSHVDLLPPPIPEPSEPLLAAVGPQQYGMIVEPTQAGRGVSIQGVVNGSSAAKAGLMPGDRVVSVDGKLAANCESLALQLQGRSQAEVVTLGVVRGSTYLIKPLKLSTVLDDSAVQNGPSESVATPEPEKGVLGGLESVLGSLLGGSSGKSSDGATQAGTTQAGATQAGATQQSPFGQRNDPAKGLGDASDPGAKPVRRSSFEETAGEKIQNLKSDPPSLKALLPESSKLKALADPSAGTQSKEVNSEAASGPTTAELREQIRKLQQQLQMLEKESGKEAASDAKSKD